MEPTATKIACNIKGVVILVDYSEISRCNYDRTVEEIVPAVGLHMASAITRMGIPPGNVELIGHSLGG